VNIISRLLSTNGLTSWIRKFLKDALPPVNLPGQVQIELIDRGDVELSEDNWH